MRCNYLSIPKLRGTAEVWEWISNFTPHFAMDEIRGKYAWFDKVWSSISLTTGREMLCSILFGLVEDLPFVVSLGCSYAASTQQCVMPYIWSMKLTSTTDYAGMSLVQEQYVYYKVGVQILGLYSLSGKTFCCKIAWSFEPRDMI